MKTKLLTILAVILSVTLFAQTPEAFKYQAVIRNNQGKVLVNQIVSLRISILQDNPLGDVVYMETHQVATTEYGIANLSIGQGTVVTGIFANINWGATTHFVKTELDITGNQNYEFIGTSQLLSVPYAMYAKFAGNASDDFDKDPSNEIQDLQLNGNTLTINKNGTATQIDLTQYLDNTDNQQLQLNGNAISITNGNSIVLPPDNDADTLNEIQTLSKTDNIISLSKNGGFVVDSDNQTISLNGNQLTISSGNTVTFTGAVDLDADPTNEFQYLSRSNDTIFLSNGAYVVLPVNLDNDSTNELQTLSVSNTTLSISNGNTVSIPPDPDFDPTNEIQYLSISNDSIFISNGNNIQLPNRINFLFPDKIDAITPLTFTGTYSPPLGKNLYITNVFSSGYGEYLRINNQTILTGYSNYQNIADINNNIISLWLNNAIINPIIVSSSDVITTNNVIVNGFITNSTITPVSIYLSSTNQNYSVPTNKILIILNVFHQGTIGSLLVNGLSLLSGRYNYGDNSKKLESPIFVNSGQTISGSDFMINGYLIDK